MQVSVPVSMRASIRDFGGGSGEAGGMGCPLESPMAGEALGRFQQLWEELMGWFVVVPGHVHGNSGARIGEGPGGPGKH